MKRHDAADLTGRVKDLREALTRSGDRLEPALAEQVQRVIDGAQERLSLGVDHTVVALLGGTGSGKSSLFNAVSGLNFADVGARRPTTSSVAACAWSTDSGALLDWIGVESERRIDRISALDGDAEDDLAGLVLLDLPDYDSVAVEHREVVDHVLPMADLLVWVVDPQKYADDTLHTGYLSKLAGAEASMMVVVNQIDTVVESQRHALITDVKKLLVADGLTGVEVAAVSAVTAEGIGQLRERFAQVAARRSVAAVRVAGELTEAGQNLAEALPAEVPRRLDQHVDQAVAAVGEVIGVTARARTVATGSDDGAGVAQQEALSGSNVEPIRAGWVGAVGQNMTPAWRTELDERVPRPQEFADQLNTSLARLRVGAVGRTRSGMMRVLALVFFIAAGIALLLGAGMLLSWFEIGSDQYGPLFCGTAALVLAAAGWVLWLISGRARRRNAQRVTDEYLDRAHERVRSVVEATFVKSTMPLLEDHLEARNLALAAVDNLTTSAEKTESSTT